MIHHVGIVTLDDAAPGLLSRLAPLRLIERREIAAWCCVCDVYRVGAGETYFEVVRPHGGKLLEWSRGRAGLGPLHHVAVRVESIEATSAQLRAAGVPLVSPEAVDGALGWRVNFVHPSYCGLMVELVEETR